MTDIERIAELTSTDVATVRLLLQQNNCPFGTAIRKDDSRRYTYILYPAKVKELFGFDLKGVEHDKHSTCTCTERKYSNNAYKQYHT